jgi:gliding motility-associated-like protein
MLKLKAIILLFIAFSTQVVAQSTVHLCVGESHDFAVPYTIGSTYDWKMQANTPIATITSGNGTEHIVMSLNFPGIFQLFVEEYNSNGCFGYDSILVEIHDNPTPNIFALGPIQFCEGVDVVLQLNDVYDSYLWSDGSSNQDLIVNSTGDYSVTVINEFGCINNSNVIHVDVQSELSADFYYEGICVNNPTHFFSTSLSVGGIVNVFNWDFGNGVQSYRDSVSHSYNLIGDYEVSLNVETDVGCKDSITKTISIFGNPKANFTYNPFTISTLNPEMNFVNTSSSGMPFLWGFGDSIYSVIENPSHIYDDPGVYDVMLIVKDMNECMDSITKKITMYYDFVLHVPTAFTPNDDNDNDTFGPQGLRMEKYESYAFYIYNQWGEIIFETDNITEWWDGAAAPHGAYTWAIIIVDELGAVRKEVGDVMLIR